MVVRGGKSADLNTGKDVLSAILLADSFTQVGTYIHLSLDVRDYAQHVVALVACAEQHMLPIFHASAGIYGAGMSGAC